MSDFDSSKMDTAANDASSELETIREEQPNAAQLVIRECIEDLGREWMDMSDARFWNERDVQVRLLQLLYGKPALVATVVSDPVHCPGKAWDIPLAHAECLAARSGAGLQGPFDIVVFAPESIKKYVAHIRWAKKGWQGKVRELEVLAAIELKDDNGECWNNSIEKDLRKLLERMQSTPIQQGYLAILFNAEINPLNYGGVCKEIKKIRNEYSLKPSIMIYFFPWSSQPVSSKGIDINSL